MRAGGVTGMFECSVRVIKVGRLFRVVLVGVWNWNVLLCKHKRILKTAWWTVHFEVVGWLWSCSS